jgi:hypothetical protein
MVKFQFARTPTYLSQVERIGIRHWRAFHRSLSCLNESRVRTVAQQPHAAIGEIDKLHAPHCIASISISDSAPKARRAVAVRAAMRQPNRGAIVM